MPTVVGVRLRFASRVLWFDPNDTAPVEGDHVIVTTERGQEYGEVVAAPHEVEESELQAPLKPVVRVATASDQERAATLAAREKEEFASFRRRVSVGVAMLFVAGGLILGGFGMAFGTERQISKYRRTFSAPQFLLSADRDHYAGTSELIVGAGLAGFQPTSFRMPIVTGPGSWMTRSAR